MKIRCVLLRHQKELSRYFMISLAGQNQHYGKEHLEIQTKLSGVKS